MNSRKLLRAILQNGSSIEREALEYIEELRAALKETKQELAKYKPKSSTVLADYVKALHQKRQGFIDKRLCPTCEGEGTYGGQFSGGEQVCEDCKGTGRYNETK